MIQALLRPAEALGAAILGSLDLLGGATRMALEAVGVSALPR